MGEEAQGQGELEGLKGLGRRLGLGRQVIFVGRVEQEQLPLYYSAADVFVVPSYYESFGLAALEAMACGTPVVATRVGGLPYLVRHGCTGYLAEERSPEAFAALVGRLLGEEGLRLQMGREALQHAQSFGWPRIVERIAALYGRLCAGRREQIGKAARK